MENFTSKFIENCIRQKMTCERFVEVPLVRMRTGPPFPSEKLLSIHFPVRSVQGKKATCVHYSMASALHIIGLSHQARLLALQGKDHFENMGADNALSAMNRGLQQFLPKWIVTKIKKKWHPLAIDREWFQWPVLAIFLGSDGGSKHAVTILRGQIFDSNNAVTLPLTSDALNWCCGSEFLYVVKSYLYRHPSGIADPQLRKEVQFHDSQRKCSQPLNPRKRRNQGKLQEQKYAIDMGIADTTKIA